MISLGNPVNGLIAPHGSAVPIGSFVVTATFGQIDASHPTPHLGVDIGNGRCGDPVIACEAGTASRILDPNGALILRVRHSPTLVTGYAHLSGFSVADGASVVRGQQVGVLGTSGASACHLHWGVNLDGVEIDGWPLLAQNQEEPMPGFKIGTNIGTFRFVGAHALISPTDPKVRYMQAADAGPWDVAASLDLKTTDNPPQPVDIDGNSPPLNKRDQVYLVDAPTFGVAAYALRSDGVFTAKPNGYTEKDLADAKRTAAHVVSSAADSAANTF